ncbi:sulfatase family protein [Sphingobacterium corticibacterium]|nr:sulfatase [Sphingobacterium corticibacterium]
MKKRIIVTITSLFAWACSCYGQLPTEANGATNRLNVLIFTADDLDRNSLGVYGSQVPDITPNIDRFANESLRFDHAFVNSAICAPSRAILATGLYAHNSGVNGFYKIKDDHKVPLIMEILREHHYALGVLGKAEHATPKDNFEWDYIFDQADLGNGRSPALYYERTKTFLSERKEDNKPFFLLVNSHDPHRPYFNPDLPLDHGEERPSRIYSPEEISVPGFLPDLPGVREELSHYFNSTRRLDDTFGTVLQALKESGLAENTVVIFLSDNGIAMPFAKANTYHASNRTPFLVYWPGVTKAASVNDWDFISTVDLVPTLLEGLGIPLLSTDGQSFFPLLKDGQQPDRDRIFAQIDYKAGGGPTPMRSIHTKRYTYIFNAWSDGERVYSNNNEGLTLKSMKEAAESDKAIAERVNLYHFRISEELYDLENDPDGLHNLIDDPESAILATEFRKSLEQWMIQTNDPLVPVYQNRHKPELANRAFYRIYPGAEELDKNKARYSEGR